MSAAEKLSRVRPASVANGAQDEALECAMDARTKLFSALENVSAEELPEARADILDAMGLVCDVLAALQTMSLEKRKAEKAGG